MNWAKGHTRSYLAIVFIWIAAVAIPFFIDYFKIENKYSLDVPELEKLIKITIDDNEPGQQGISARKKDKSLKDFYRDCFITEINNDISIDTLESVNEFVGEIQLRGIQDKVKQHSRDTAFNINTTSIADYKKSKEFVQLDHIDKFYALQHFFRVNVLTEIELQPKETLSGVFAELSRDIAYSEARNKFFADEVLPEVEKAPSLRRVANAIFGLDHTRSLYEAHLNTYILVKFSNNNAMFIPYDVNPSISAVTIAKYINGLKNDEILDIISLWGTYAFIPPLILLLFGLAYVRVRYGMGRGKEDYAEK